MKALFGIGAVFACVSATCFVAMAEQPGPATIICHRGLCGAGALDNSYTAFSRAVGKGMGFECDVRVDDQGRVYCAHDKRLAALDGKPTYFPDVLALARPGRWIVVDVKGEEGRTEALAEGLRRDLSSQSAANPSNILFICQKLDWLKAVRRALPEYKVLWLTGCALRGDFPEEAMTVGQMISHLKQTGANGVDLSDRPEIFTSAFIGRLRAEGYEVHMCTRGERALVEDAFCRGAQLVTPISRAYEILEEIQSAH